jgi:hypothetical protein
MAGPLSAGGALYVSTVDGILRLDGADGRASRIAVSCGRLEHAPDHGWALRNDSPSSQLPQLPSDNVDDQVLAVSCLPAPHASLLAPVLVTAGSQAVSLLQLGPLGQRRLCWQPLFRVALSAPLSGRAPPACSIHTGPLLAIHIAGQGLLLSWRAQAAAGASQDGAAAQPQWTSHLLPKACLPAADRLQVLSCRLSGGGCTAWLAASLPGGSKLLRVRVPAGEGAALVEVQHATTPSISCALELPREPAGGMAGAAAGAAAAAAPSGASGGEPLLLLGSLDGSIRAYDASSRCCGRGSSAVEGPVRQLALLQQLALSSAANRGAVAALHGDRAASSLTLLRLGDLQQLATVPGVSSIVHCPWLGRLPAAPGSSSGAGLALLAVPQGGEGRTALAAERHGALVVQHQGRALLGFPCFPSSVRGVAPLLGRRGGRRALWPHSSAPCVATPCELPCRRKRCA